MIKTFIDKDNVFYLFLLNGLTSGYDVFGMMEKLYQADSSNPLDLSKATNKVENKINNKNNDKEKTKELFPCIIIVKRDFLRQWLKAEHGYLGNLEKVKNIYDYLKEHNKGESEKGLWPTYQATIEREIKRVRKMIAMLQEYADKFDRNLTNIFGFFNNSSIWIRLVDRNRDEISNAKKELEYFESIGLYDYGSAKENLEYNIRLQEQNYLDSTTQGHGVYVTPQLYGDETEHWKILSEDNKCDK